MEPLTRKEKKQITNDWKETMKHYMVDQTCSLIKRNDPLVTGIYLHTGTSARYYSPVFYMHSLMVPFGSIALGGYGPMRLKNQANDAISYKRHSEEFEKIVMEFKNQYPIAFLDYVGFDDVSSYYDSFIKKPASVNPYPLGEMRDHILLMFWVGKNEGEIKEKISSYQEIIDAWPKTVHPMLREDWDNIQNLMNLEDISMTVESEVA